MSVPSLLDLTACEVMTCIFEGSLPPSAYQLDRDSSNRLFEEYCRIYDIEITRSIIKEICSILNVTKVDMRHCIVQRSEILILENQELESFVMGSLTQLEPKRREVFAVPTKYLKIDALLKRCLNEKSRQKLTHLDLSQTGGEYLDGWVENISRLLPSLISLGIAGRYLTAPAFLALCTNYPSLTNLDISNSDVKNLNGIGNLLKLEVLAIGGLDIVDMNEIFELKKLRVLDLSSRKCLCCHGDLLYEYLKCHRVLPDLRFIDCSGNFATDELISHLLATHETIQKIGLIGIVRDFPDYPGVRLLTFNSIRTATEAVRYYTTSKNYTAVTAILKSIFSILEEDYDDQAEETIKECYFAICKIIKEFPDGQSLHKLVTDCLRLMCSDTRIYMLTAPERHDLVNTLFTVCDHWPNYKSDSEQSDSIHNVWRIFQNFSFLLTRNLNLKRIFEVAMEYVIMEDGEGDIQECCLKVMMELVDQMSQSDQLSIFVDRDTCRHFLDLLNKLYKKNRFEMYPFVLANIYKIVDFNADVFLEMGGVNVLIRHLKKHNCYDSLFLLRMLVTRENREFVKEMAKSENVQRLVYFLRACALQLEISPNAHMIKEKTYLVTSILSEIIFHKAENHLNTFYWRTITQILKEVFVKLSGAPDNQPCPVELTFFDTYLEIPRRVDILERPIENLRRNRNERGHCLYC